MGAVLSRIPRRQGKTKDPVDPGGPVDPKERNTYMAIHNFLASQPDELTIRKGDMIEVEFTAEQCEKSQWWRASNLETNRSGLVPYNYITKYTGMPCLLSGWMDCNRMDANRMLLRAGLPAGTYIIRPCARQNAGLAKLELSVRTPDRECENNFLVKHYQIKNSIDGAMFFINKAKVYPTVQKLIDEYKRELQFENSLNLGPDRTRPYTES